MYLQLYLKMKIIILEKLKRLPKIQEKLKLDPQ
jgi:hypothetical protein